MNLDNADEIVAFTHWLRNGGRTLTDHLARQLDVVLTSYVATLRRDDGVQPRSGAGVDVATYKPPASSAVVKAADITTAIQEITNAARSDAATNAMQDEAIFSYWAAKTGRDMQRTLLTRDRRRRIARFRTLYGINACLYAVDGALRHPDLNHQDGRSFHELSTIFPLNEVDRFEKLCRCIRAYDRGEVHPLLMKYPALDGNTP